MNKNALKIELIQKVIACNDATLLKQIEDLLRDVKVEVNEPGEGYEVKNHKNLLSKEQLEELERRRKAYKSGAEKAIPWEEAKREIERKYGF